VSVTTTDRYYTVIQCHGIRSDGIGKGTVILWSLCGIFNTEEEALAFLAPINTIINGVPSHVVFTYPRGSDVTELVPLGQMMEYNGTEPFGPWQIGADLLQGFE